MNQLLNESSFDSIHGQEKIQIIYLFKKKTGDEGQAFENIVYQKKFIYTYMYSFIYVYSHQAKGTLIDFFLKIRYSRQ